MDREAERATRRRRHHDRWRMQRRAYRVLGDWEQAAKRADYLSRCPQGCAYCANPRRTRRGKARLTLAERRILDSLREQLRELIR